MARAKLEILRLLGVENESIATLGIQKPAGVPPSKFVSPARDEGRASSVLGEPKGLEIHEFTNQHWL